jgi:hypothetical protein
LVALPWQMNEQRHLSTSSNTPEVKAHPPAEKKHRHGSSHENKSDVGLWAPLKPWKKICCP